MIMAMSHQGSIDVNKRVLRPEQEPFDDESKEPTLTKSQGQDSPQHRYARPPLAGRYHPPHQQWCSEDHSVDTEPPPRTKGRRLSTLPDQYKECFHNADTAHPNDTADRLQFMPPNGQRVPTNHFDRPQQPIDNELSSASRNVDACHLESNTFFSTKNDIAERFCGISFDMDSNQEAKSAGATTIRISPLAPQFGRPELAKAIQGLVPGGTLPGAYMVRPPLDENPSFRDPENEEASCVPSSTFVQADTSTDHKSHNFGKQRKCVVIGTLALLVLIITGTGTGIGVFLHIKGDNSPLSGGDVTYCDLQGMDQPDFQRQCSCRSRVDILSQETLARLDDVQAVLGLTRSQVNITSCEPDNISLLLLASTDTSLVSDENVLIRYVLNIIYLSMGGTNWTNHDGWLKSNESCTCCFYGVRCEGESVVAIELPANKLVGTIPSELALVPALSSLDLSGNEYISGTLPTVLGKLTNLVSLSLDDNAITGSIPSELGLLSKLESLLLSDNDMKGSIPEELGANLTRLIQFGVGGNLIDLDGPIPMWLLKPSMTFLDLYECGIGGSLPSQLGLMTDLRELHLNVNFLRGTFPTEIGLLTKLQVLELSINSIEGTLPAQLSSCISLTKLYLYENLLEGTIPNDALGRLSHLRIVDISGTGLSGSIPASEDSGLCGLRSSVNLSELVVDCSGVSQVVCDCCTECSRKKKGYVATLCCD